MKQTMKIFGATLMLALMMSTVVMAQDHVKRQNPQGEKPSPEERAERMTTKMTQHLGLNDLQAEQIGIMNSSFTSSVASIHESNLEKEQKKTALKEAFSNYEGQIQNVLTEEQFNKFLKAKERRLEKRKDRKNGSCSGKGKKHTKP